MATSSIFTDFSIRDKKTAHAFVKAIEASEKAPSQQGTANCSIVESPDEIRKIASALKGKANGKRR